MPKTPTTEPNLPSEELLFPAPKADKIEDKSKPEAFLFTMAVTNAPKIVGKRLDAAEDAEEDNPNLGAI